MPKVTKQEAAKLIDLKSRVQAELNSNILPFWKGQSVDETYGGFIGRISQDGQRFPEAPKAAVLNTRILWSFAVAARSLGDQHLVPLATRAYTYLHRYFKDEAYGGVYWMLDHTGRVLEAKKQVYAQAFAIYSLVEYYRTTRHEEALAWAIDLFNALEHHAHDPQHGGYYEAYSQQWTTLGDVRLSDKDANEPKSMNTHLHVLEAYTVLFKVWPDPKLCQQLRSLIDLFLSQILNRQQQHLHLFFDDAWTTKSQTVSFGHDIEASWLLTEAAQVLGDPLVTPSVHQAALSMAHATLRVGRDADGSLYNEVDSQGHCDEDRHWWPQAEAVVGFLNAYQLSGAPEFLEAALACWAYIERHIVDNDHGEWYFRVSKEGLAYTQEDKLGPWKGPYHNTRACLEVMARVDDMVLHK